MTDKTRNPGTGCISIPPAALEAGCSAYTAVIYRGNGTQAEFRAAILAAFVAMVAAWPGMHMGHQCSGCGGDPQIILPLTEKQDDNG